MEEKKSKTLNDVEKQTKSFRTSMIRPVQSNKETVVKKVPFYNWLEERE